MTDTGFHSGQTDRAGIHRLAVGEPAGAGPGRRQPGAFSLILFKEGSAKFLNLEITALQADGKGKIISSPRVITADQVEAIIEQGTEIPYQQATSSGATSVSFKKATLSLKVKPQITPDDNVIMNLNVNKDSVGANTLAGPSIDTKQIVTEVLVENGGTVVIGGIYTQDREQRPPTRCRCWATCRIVGFLFKQNLKVDDRSELLIFITPRDPQGRPDAAPVSSGVNRRKAASAAFFVAVTCSALVMRHPAVPLESLHGRQRAETGGAARAYSRQYLPGGLDGRGQDLGGEAARPAPRQGPSTTATTKSSARPGSRFR